MGEGNGTTRTNSAGSQQAVIESLRNSSNFWISSGMNRYDSEKNDPRYDFSDMRNLSEADKTFLVAYLSHSYDTINSQLRASNLTNDVKQMVKGIDQAIDRLDKFEGTVYRNVRFNTGSRRADTLSAQELLDYYKSHVGQTVTEKQYISSGKTKSKIDRKFYVDSDRPGIKFTIESKTGRNLTHYNNEEDEILFRRNTRFRVVSVRGNVVHLKEV